MVTALFTFLRKLSECARVLAPFFEVASGYKRCEDASQFHSASRDGGQAARNLLNLCPAANRFERAVFRWSLSHEWGKFHFARDQIGGFKFPFAH